MSSCMCLLAKHLTTLKWKDAIYVFSVSPGSAEALAKWGGKTKNILIAYFLCNVFTKNYRNRFICVEVIAKQRWDVFWYTVYWTTVGLNQMQQRGYCCRAAAASVESVDFLNCQKWIWLMTTTIPFNGPLPRSTWVSRHQKETFTHSHPVFVAIIHIGWIWWRTRSCLHVWLMCCAFQECRTTAASRSLTACLPRVSLNLVS